MAHPGGADSGQEGVDHDPHDAGVRAEGFDHDEVENDGQPAAPGGAAPQNCSLLELAQQVPGAGAGGVLINREDLVQVRIDTS